MFSFELGSESPFPTDFFMAMNRISYLRAIRSAGIPAKSTMAAAQPTLNQVRAFKFGDWIEAYSIPDGPVFPIMFRVFRSAVLLYGWLSLFESRPDHQQQKVELREELAHSIREVADIVDSRLPLAWPLSVLAVALNDGPQEDKDLIEDILCNGYASDNFYVPRFRVNMLKKFWDSGSTSWDDCYFEPFPPLS